MTREEFEQKRAKLQTDFDNLINMFNPEHGDHQPWRAAVNAQNAANKIINELAEQAFDD